MESKQGDRKQGKKNELSIPDDLDQLATAVETSDGHILIPENLLEFSRLQISNRVLRAAAESVFIL